MKDDRKNILWLSHLIPYPPKGGVLQRAYHLVRETARYHNVYLLAFNQPDLIEPLFPNLEKGIQEARDKLSAFCKHVEFVNIPLEQRFYGKERMALSSLFSKHPYNLNWLISDEYRLKIKAIMSKTEIDLIHFDTISLLPYKDLAKDLPTALDHHNIESHMLIRRADNEKNFLRRFYFRQEGRRLEAIEKEACPTFSLNITCSKIDADRLTSIAGKCESIEVPNGVDVDFFKCSNKQLGSTPRLLFVGTLSWYPNAEAANFIANELWPILNESIPNIEFDIVGANPARNLLTLAQSEPRFKVHGFVNDVRDYFEKADIFICPISDGGGTKLKVLDAFAMEMPVIAHPVACEGINVTQDKNVLFAQTPKQYIEKISYLLNNESIKYNLGMEARKLVEDQYAYNSIGQKLTSLYNNCIINNR